MEFVHNETRSLGQLQYFQDAAQPQGRILAVSTGTVKLPKNQIDFRMTELGLDEFVIELGIYFVALVICMLVILHQVQGSPTHLGRYMLFRKLEIFPNANRNSSRVATMLQFSAYFYITAPFLILIGWFLLLAWDEYKEGASAIPAFCTLIIGISFIVFALNIMFIIWNKYQFNVLNVILQTVAIFLLTLYQCIVIFGYQNQEKFLPYSAIFLNFNVMFLALAVFIDKYDGAKDILSLMVKCFPMGQKAFDRNRDNNIQEEVEEQKADPNYKLSFQDLTDMLTIQKVSGVEWDAALGGGVVQRFNNLGGGIKIGAKLGLVLVSLLVLVGYTLALFFADNKNTLGIIIAVSVVCMDLFNFVIYMSGMIESASGIVTMLVLNRILMVIFGEKLWVYGFMVLFVMYGVWLVYLITKENFPLESDVVLQKHKVADMVKGLASAKSKAQAREQLRKGVRPGYLLLFLTVLYIIFIIIIEAISPKNLSEFILNYSNPDKNTHKKLRPIVAALFSILLIFTFYFVLACIRIMIRKATRCQQYGQEDVQSLLKNFKYVDLMTLYMVFCWLAFVIWAVIGNWILKSTPFLLWGIIGSLVILSFGRAYVFFALNDWDYFQDVEKLNKFIDRHNKEVVENERKKLVIQQQLADGTLLLPPPSESNNNPPPPAPSSGGGGTGGGPSQQIEDQPEAPKPDQPAPIDHDLAAQQAEQQKVMQDLIRREQEQKKKEEDEKQKKLEQDANLRQQQEEQKKQMEEQKRLEEQRKIERQKLLDEEKKADQERKAEQQREDQRKRKEEEQSRSNNVSQNNNTQYNFSGSAQQSAKIDRNKAYKEEEIYEGGDEENQVPKADANVIEIDLDMAEKEPNGYQKIARSQLKRVKEWNLLHSNWFDAFLKGALRPNDMNFLWSLIAAIIFFFILLIALTFGSSGITGAITVWPMLYLMICLIIGSTVIGQSRAFNIKEAVIWIVINVLFLGIGLVFFIWQYEIKDFKYDLSKRDKKQGEAAQFVLAYVFLVPTLGHGLICALRIADRGLDKFHPSFTAFAIAFGVGVFLMIISCFLFVHWINGIIFLVAVIFLIYVAAQIFLYIKNDFYTPPMWQLVNNTLLVLTILFAFVWSAFDKELSSYAGGSYSAAILFFFLWSYAISQFVIDFSERETKPIYVSTNMFPVYKFNPKINDVEDHYDPAISFILGLVIAAFWGLITNTQVHPTYWGPLITIGIQLLIMICSIHLRSLQLTGINDAYDLLTPEIARGAWIETKKHYIKNKGALTRADLRTYRRMWKRQFSVTNYVNCLDGRPIQKPPRHPVIDKTLAEEVMPGDNGHLQYYKDQVKKFLISDRYNIDSIADMTSLMFELSEQCRDSYMDEMQLIVSFVLIAAQNSVLGRQQKRKEFFRFLKDKKDIFHALGIGIQIPISGTTDQKYDMVQGQINDLSPTIKKIFDQIHQLYLNEDDSAKEQREKVKKDEDDRQNNRDNEAEEMKKKREEELKKLEEEMARRREEQQAQGKEVDDGIDIDMDIDNMPDCRMKYSIIVARAAKGKGKFEDKQFKHNDSVLPEDMARRVGDSPMAWIRASDGMDKVCGGAPVVFEDGVDASDVKQGGLGDCYYLSALTCMGDRFTRDKFVFLNTDDEWEKSGAFCIKFYEQGEEQIVIIDDFIPTVHEQFIFAESAQKKEIWPQLLEKAYAKKYGGYNKIEGGLVHTALAELTNGAPDYIDPTKEKNLTKLWNTLLQYQKEGAMLGAGSNSHADGDSATSKLGIVQGHAFTILRLFTADKAKLMQIRNPWGKGEWTGDWSDDSSLWTTRMRNLVNWHDVKDDGIFWIDLSDFVTEFDAIYVCRDFSNETVWKKLQVQDEWKGKYAEGLPNKENPRAQMEKNPQYGVTITKPCQAYIVLRLKDKESPHKSKQYGYVNVQNNEGKLISHPSKALQVGGCGPTNQTLQSFEIDFSNKLSYPRTFSIVVANMNHGAKGEGSYTLDIFTKDHNCSLKKLN